MGSKGILMYAAVGLAGVAVGGTLWGLLGVASVFIAVWGICERQWMRNLQKEYGKVYSTMRDAEFGEPVHSVEYGSVLQIARILVNGAPKTFIWTGQEYPNDMLKLT